ncbi:DNA-binding transcriptional regulator, MarR family [Saccharopolyspora antimicrobica]|uniref:DNA-binding MarR family transcriptional regulator n=1 Tax=Saccharopolyspora antimicrobica TaxID=455193 RepID=A0A1I4QA58_9PSEU|nr:MarR family winged helix-turn-helix transcriptional regulator [Saccharopolyspora antimicrobica]RKT84841.1 DNA-binding MarR family transcriptional regulator [Saccharopolyspora antimicrobica]SFM36924.1 DNA-binding transcriptional regulator, MarR family [Saccharopolyspora antimicrobica]
MAAESPGIAFLLSQLGAHAATQFGARVEELGLTPPLVGVLRMISAQPGLSQQQLAGELGLLPSKVVAFVDDLERRGLVTRTRGTRDRRVQHLTLTTEGTELLGEAIEAGAQHEDAFCQALAPDERAQLKALLERLARSHELAPGVHPGYRWIR